MERAYESSEARQYNPQLTNSFRGKLLLLLVCYVYFNLVTDKCERTTMAIVKRRRQCNRK